MGLVMRAISKKLVQGRIDQVESTVSFTWVKPRVLDSSRIAMLEQRLDSWGSRTLALEQKMRMAALMELVFQRAKMDRVVGFSDIATQCRVQPAEVEHLVMRAISKKRGSAERFFRRRRMQGLPDGT